MQNAVDAVTARRRVDPQAPAAIRISVDGQVLRVHDPGIGLTEADGWLQWLTDRDSGQDEETADTH